MGSQKGFTLIELIIVIAIMGLVLSLATPRLSAFFERPEDHELRDFDQFILRSARTAILPRGRFGSDAASGRGAARLERNIDAKPVRLSIRPPRTVLLLEADTDLSRFDFTLFRIESVEEDGRAAALEPELPFTSLGMLPPFSLKLSDGVHPPFWWRMNRIGDIAVETHP